jgi:LacI family transcriptional regulator
VAAAAGVSVTTVSHVLNETPHTRTSDETKARVREAAAQLGYQPNRLARGLRTQASGMVGLVTEEIATTPHAGRIILGAQEEASRRNLMLSIINSELNAAPEVSSREIQAFIDRQVDGVIYATVFHDEVVLPSEFGVVPAVIIGARDSESSIPSVMPDERGGAESVVELLVSAGHRRIAFAATSVDVPATRGRLAGYRAAMVAAGLDPDACVVEAEAEASGGYEATHALLNHDRPADQRPTAVFCYNDRMAMGAYRAIAELGLSIPRDVSVVGFDDQAPIPESLYPALTTVALPHYEMGAAAVEMIASLQASATLHGTGIAESRVLRCPVLERASVAPPP